MPFSVVYVHKTNIMKLTKLFGTILFAGMIFFGKTGFAQTAAPQTALNEKVVRAYYTAFVKKDWNLMQTTLADGFTFSSPLDDHISVIAFKEKCWPNAYKIKKIDVDKIVMNGDQAVVITNGWTTTGKLFRNSDYFKLKDGKITAYECFFGPGVNYPNNAAK
jgi:hypothetical protein